MKKTILLLGFIIIAFAADAQLRPYIINADSIEFGSNSAGNNTQFRIKNSTRNRTGAFLLNFNDGRTRFAYALDSASVSNDTLFLYRANHDTVKARLGTPGALTGITATLPLIIGGLQPVIPNIRITEASATDSGYVTNRTQSFSGQKTFTSNTYFSANINALNIPSSSSSSDLMLVEDTVTGFFGHRAIPTFSTPTLNQVARAGNSTDTNIVISNTGTGGLYSILETHNKYAVAADFYTHDNAAFRAPYVNFYRSRGTQASPTAVQVGAYETTSIGGINFGGYDGTSYIPATGIYNEPDENWTTARRGAHLSIYGTSFGAMDMAQIAQFGGRDATDDTVYTGNIIFYRPLTFGGNGTGNAAWYYSNDVAPIIRAKNGRNTADIGLTSGAFYPSGTLGLNKDSVDITAGKTWGLVLDTTSTTWLGGYRVRRQAIASGVTSVATGLGLSGGPITSTGTLLVDTASASILSRQRAAATYLPLTGGTLTGNLLFTDATYDIGASGATRPRDIYLSRNLTVGNNITVTGFVSSGEVRATSYYYGFGTSGSRGWFHSPSDGVFTMFNSATTGFTRINGGGVTSSFPAWTVASANWRLTDASGGDASGLSIGEALPASAKVSIASTTQGFLPPRMTATQGSAISSPAEGLLIYVTDTNGTFTAKGWWGYDGSAWQKLNN